jgi:hypothetical protein
MVMTPKTLLSSVSALALALQLCASSPVLAMDPDNLRKAPAAKAAKILPQDIVKKAMTDGYFVHAFPQNLSEYDWTLRAGTLTPITFRPNPDGFRPCLYFTLNTLIESHEALNTSVYNSAVLIPSRELLRDVVNMSPRDMAVWRPEIDLRTIPGAILVVPEDQTKGVSHPRGLVYSYKNGKTLSGAVKALLKSKGVEEVTLQDGPQDQENYFDKAMVGGVNIETCDAFAEFLGNPAISFGHEKGPKRTGLGPYMGILQPFVENANKLCGRGRYSGIRSHYSKYRPEPYRQLAAVALEEMGALVERLGNQSILDNFTTVQRGKVEQVLRGLDEFIREHQSSLGWEDKLYTSDIALRLADMPYEVARKVLDHASLDPVKEEMETLYWACRWNQAFPAYGVQPPDDLNVLTQLETAAGSLKTKLDAGRYSWFYAQYLNHLLAIYVPGQSVKGFADHYLQALRALRTTLPQSGWVKKQHGTAPEETILWKDTLTDRFGLKLPEDLLTEGLTEIPLLQTPHSQDEAF